jgi:hypothetical protein
MVRGSLCLAWDVFAVGARMLFRGSSVPSAGAWLNCCRGSDRGGEHGHPVWKLASGGSALSSWLAGAVSTRCWPWAPGEEL